MKLSFAPLLSAAAVATWINCRAQSNVYAVYVNPRVVLLSRGEHRFSTLRVGISIGPLLAEEEGYWTDSTGRKITDGNREDRKDDKLHRRTVLCLGSHWITVPLPLTWTAVSAGSVLALLCFLAIWCATRWRDWRDRGLADETTPSDSAPG